MFTNLKNRLHEKGIYIKAFAEFLDVSEKTAHNKLSGNTPFTLSEANKIKTILFPELEWNFLFAVDKAS